MTIIYNRDIVVSGDIYPGASATFELPEGTIATASVFIWCTVGSAATPVGPTSRVGDFVTFLMPLFDAGTTITLSISQDRDFIDTSDKLVAGTVTTLAVGAPATITIDKVTTPGSSILNLGIPASAGTPGTPGKDGVNGTDGTNGTNGTPGTNGVDGKNGTSVTVTAVTGGASVSDGTTTVVVANGPKGDVGPVGPAGPTGMYREIAGGTLWAIRPRFDPVISKTTSQGITYDYINNTSNFVVESQLYTDSGIPVPAQSAPNRSKGGPEFHVVRPSNPGTFGLSGQSARIASDSLLGAAVNVSDYNGWYWVETTTNAADIIDLSKIEVQCNPVHDAGYQQKEDGDGFVKIEQYGHARGMVFPVYMGASVINGKIRLWFRFLTYCFRAPKAGISWSSTTNYGMWDGIGNDYDAWDLDVAEVHWWTTNVAQGLQFNARVRN